MVATLSEKTKQNLLKTKSLSSVLTRKYGRQLTCCNIREDEDQQRAVHENRLQNIIRLVSQSYPCVLTACPEEVESELSKQNRQDTV